MHWRHPHPYLHPQQPFQTGTRVPVAGTHGCANGAAYCLPRRHQLLRFQSPMLMKHGEIDDHQDFCPPSCHQLLRFQFPMPTKHDKITDHQDFCLPASPGQSAT
ncbi:hypothetical protein PCANC_02396 [Puccinia coronata f. sp. avenae]|uniref:Uncharacterized protein n=1 Tax=Puccinia coronata f. sp. avenae TaxID=200324 RepID=A0A2N5W4T5_9BASI|nr:hypothetical protein PCANC_02396 [Puccinia coronata f. sp. avenae]